MKILVTGGAGYIGSILSWNLLQDGHEVTILDSFRFGVKSLKSIINHPNLSILIEDITMIEDYSFLSNFEVVVHLAAIVGDPACAADASTAVATNYSATKTLVDNCLKYKVPKFVFSSTCSVYGASSDPDVFLDEQSELNPVSLYAETKIKAENYISDKASQSSNFHAIILRLGTIYGLSPRPRFDLVINFLTGKLYFEKNGKIFGGDQWRPFVHVRDVAQAFHLVATLGNFNELSGEIFNVGSNTGNHQMKDLMKYYFELIPDAQLTLDESIVDNRNYRVKFDKITERLGFDKQYKIPDGISEIINSFEKQEIKDYKRQEYRNYNPPN